METPTTKEQRTDKTRTVTRQDVRKMRDTVKEQQSKQQQQTPKKS